MRAAATDEVAALVLRNNYLQSQAISLMERRAVEDLPEHQQLLRWLERHGELDRAVEFLPSEEELEERRQQGRGPDTARTCVATRLRQDRAQPRALTQTGSAADPYLARELEGAIFTQALQRRFPDRIQKHRLRRQIITTAITNSIVNRVGPALLMQCTEYSGANAAAVARAYTIARDSADLRSFWSQLEALDGRIKAADQADAMLETSRYLRHLTLWLLAHRREFGQIGAAVARLQPALREFMPVIAAALEGLDRERYAERCRRYALQGLPERLGESLAALEPMRVAPDLVELMASSRTSARAVARSYFGLGAELGLDWLHGAIEQLPASGSWQRSAQSRLQALALAAHLRISASARCVWRPRALRSQGAGGAPRPGALAADTA